MDLETLDQLVDQMLDDMEKAPEQENTQNRFLYRWNQAYIPAGKPKPLPSHHIDRNNIPDHALVCVEVGRNGEPSSPNNYHWLKFPAAFSELKQAVQEQKKSSVTWSLPAWDPATSPGTSESGHQPWTKLTSMP